ncbi:MAG: zinc-binding dehydrogenase [Planctomycetota bacterium]
MRAIVISRQDATVAPNVDFRDDWPDPAPAPGEVLIRTEASALNHLDLWVGRGIPGLDLTYPRVSGSDAAGRVEGVGEGVDPAWVDRRVLLNAAVPQAARPHPESLPTPPDIAMIGEHRSGTLAERFAAPVENIVDIGAFPAAEAAAAGLTFLTAWRMLHTRAHLQPGQWVLIPGIGGGVALACLAIARYHGCRTIVTSRHQGKLDRARELGADHALLDAGEDFSREVRSITGRRGVDVCADSVGRAVHASCLKSLARGGTFVTCGCTSGPNPPTDLARIFWNQLTLLGSTMGNMDEMRQVVALLLAGSLQPVIDSVHEAADGREAYARLESGEQFGKVVVRWS